MKNVIKKITGKKIRRIGMAGVILSALLGLEIEAVFYFVFGINPDNIPLAAIVLLWVANSVISACLLDEIVRFKIILENSRKKISRV